MTTTISDSLYDADRGLPAAGHRARNVDSLLNQQILPALSQQLLEPYGGGQKPRR
jgi:type VI secretion system protein VasG